MNDNKMSIDARLVALLRCPVDGSTLAIADADLVNTLNDSIAAGELRDRLDQKITQPIDAALTTPDQRRFYCVRGGIPTLIADEAIEWSPT
ncbi:MAG: Trm112 family protein [Pirellulaceae bacterium]|nr:Trm112 family protein [Pirellulaceae bacterium]